MEFSSAFWYVEAIIAINRFISTCLDMMWKYIQGKVRLRTDCRDSRLGLGHASKVYQHLFGDEVGFIVG